MNFHVLLFCLFFALLFFFVLHHRNPIGTFLIWVIEVFFLSKHFIGICFIFLGLSSDLIADL